jgi:hypothetical protein
MKADHRKELETNALLVRMSHWKEKIKGRAAYIVGGALVLIIGLGLTIWIWRSNNAAAASARLMELNSADTEKQLDEIISSPKHMGKPTATWAKLQKARLLLHREGLEKIGTADAAKRKAAFAKIEEGRKLYLELVGDLKDTPTLQQEALLGCAFAEEVLLGTPKEDKNDEFRGNFDTMIKYYRQAAEINPGSDASKSYVATADKKKSQQAEIEKFYKDLNQLGFVGKGLDGFGGKGFDGLDGKGLDFPK